MYLTTGLREEFSRALDDISTTKFHVEDDHYAHFFETVTRYLGGLLSAYTLSNGPVLLKKADELGTKLLPAFSTRSGLPSRGVNTRTARISEGPGGGSSLLLAELGSCQLEYRYLAHLTDKAIYYEVVDKVNNILESTQQLHNNSLWASHWETSKASQAISHYSVGAWTDSAVKAQEDLQGISPRHMQP